MSKHYKNTNIFSNIIRDYYECKWKTPSDIDGVATK